LYNLNAFDYLNSLAQDNQMLPTVFHLSNLYLRSTFFYADDDNNIRIYSKVLYHLITNYINKCHQNLCFENWLYYLKQYK